MSMKSGRENKGFGGVGGGPPADLLVCFPSRARLALMPKPICSPVRPNSEPNKRPHLKKINTTRGRAGGGPPSTLLWAKGNQVSSSSTAGGDLAEPTSPKVTCAGQIKVRPRSSGGATCRNWQSVMEEIERLHNSRSSSKHNNDKMAANKGGKKSKYSWGEALGFKKDIVNFLTCLGNIRFDFRCFGSFPHPDISSDEEEDDDDDEEEPDEDDDEEDQRNNTVFSKWFMVLQENQDVKNNNEATNTPTIDENDENEDPELEPQVQVPPPNALLLMRCRSAPAVKRFNNPTQVQPTTTSSVCPANCNAESGNEKVNEKVEEDGVNKEKPKKKRRESLAIVMKYDTDFYDLSPEVCQETWLVGDLRDAINLSRSRSCKR